MIMLNSSVVPIASPTSHASGSARQAEMPAVSAPSGQHSPAQVVVDFLYDWRFGIVQAFETWVHPECIFETPGQPACHGMAEISAALAGYLKISRMPFGVVDIIHISSIGNVVLAERFDTLYGDYGDELGLKLMCRFEVKARKIFSYASYFDPSPFKC